MLAHYNRGKSEKNLHNRGYAAVKSFQDLQITPQPVEQKQMAQVRLTVSILIIYQAIKS